MISRAARRTNSQIALFAVAVQPDPKIKARLVELGGTVRKSGHFLTAASCHERR